MGNCFKKESNGTIRVEEWNQSNAPISRTEAIKQYKEAQERLREIEKQKNINRLNFLKRKKALLEKQASLNASYGAVPKRRMRLTKSASKRKSKKTRSQHAKKTKKY